MPERETAGLRVARRILATVGDSDERVADVRIGLGYTSVLLEGGSLGVAYTFRDQAKGGCTAFHGLRPLASRPASDLLPLISSADPIEAGVALACANAVANGKAKGLVPGDTLECVEVRPSDDVAMVGRFGPLIRPLRDRARSLVVIEQRPSKDALPATEAVAVLPRCQVAFITATSIINHTIDGLLAAARGCREVVILGASTPFVPEAFEGEGVTALSGIVARDAGSVQRVVSEGGGMRAFGPFVRKQTFWLGSARAKRVEGAS